MTSRGATDNKRQCIVLLPDHTPDRFYSVFFRPSFKMYLSSTIKNGTLVRSKWTINLVDLGLLVSRYDGSQCYMRRPPKDLEENIHKKRLCSYSILFGSFRSNSQFIKLLGHADLQAIRITLVTEKWVALFRPI